MRLDELTAGLGAAAAGELGAAATVEITGLAYDSRAVRAGRAVLLRAAAFRATVTTHAAAGGRPRAPSALVVERPLGLGVPEVRGALGARGDGARSAARFYGDPSAAAARGRRHRHQRQDHDRLPGARAAGGRRRAVRAARARSSRSSAASSGRCARTTPEAIDLQARLRARCSTAAIAPARWRSPRTRSSSAAPTRSTSPPRSSPT